MATNKFITMKNILIALLAGIPALTFAQEDFTLKGKIASYNAPAKVYLQYIDGGQRKLDSAAITNGQFTINGTVANPVEAEERRVGKEWRPAWTRSQATRERRANI